MCAHVVTTCVLFIVFIYLNILFVFVPSYRKAIQSIASTSVVCIASSPLSSLSSSSLSIMEGNAFKSTVTGRILITFELNAVSLAAGGGAEIVVDDVRPLVCPGSGAHGVYVDVDDVDLGSRLVSPRYEDAAM